MYTTNELQDIYKLIFKESKADETEVLFSEHESATTRFSNNVITQNLSQKNKSVSIKVIDSKRIGVAETNDFNHSSLLETLEKAVQSASYQKSRDDIQHLTEPQKYKVLHNFDESSAFLDPIEKAKWVKKAVEKAQSEGCTSSGIISNGWEGHSIGNSRGLFAYHKYSQIDFNLSLEKGEATGWYEQSSWKLSDINLDSIIERALNTTLMNKSPIDLEPGDYTVVLSPEAVGDLLYFLAFAGLATQDIVEKANYFHDKLGQKVFSDKITIGDDASHPLSAGLPFDFEGMPREKVTLIEQGVFKDMVLDRRLAQDFNKTSTGHSLPQPNSYGPLPLNLVMESGDQSMEDMIASTEHGLFVNRFHYTNLLDPMTLNLTGMTRDGLFLIQHGKITQSVRNFRFTESLVKAFNEVEAVGDHSTYIRSFFGGGFVVPGVKINRFHFSSKTGF